MPLQNYKADVNAAGEHGILHVTNSIQSVGSTPVASLNSGRTDVRGMRL